MEQEMDIECRCGTRFVFTSHPKEDPHAMVKRWNKQGEGHLRFSLENDKIIYQCTCEKPQLILDFHCLEEGAFWVPSKEVVPPWQRKKKDALYKSGKR